MSIFNSPAIVTLLCNYLSKGFVLQTERAFTPPLVAIMGNGTEPNPRNISSPKMTSFNPQSWAAVTEEMSAHPIGGLRFSSFRYMLTHLYCLCLAQGKHCVLLQYN